MQKHVDTAQVVGGDIHLLAIKTIAHRILAQNLRRLQQQGAGATGRVVSLIDFGLAHSTKARQQNGHLGGSEELATALARIGGVHAHQVFIGIAKGINAVVLDIAQIHILDAQKQLGQTLVALRHCRAQLVAVHIKIVKKALKIVLGLATLGRVFDAVENTL